MYGQSPYGNVMGRGMFMQPQMQQMLQMRDQMRMQQPSLAMSTSSGNSQIDEQMNSPEYQALVQRFQDSRGQDLDAEEQLNGYQKRFGQMQPQQQTTEQTLEQLQGNMQQMQSQQQQLSQHLGAGSGMLQQQGGLGGLYSAGLNLRNNEAVLQTQGPMSMGNNYQNPRLRSFQGNPFGA